MIAAIYAGKSDNDARSVEEQISVAKRFVEEKGWTVGPCFSDNDLSGKLAAIDRPGCKALMAEVARKSKAFGAVVMVDTDRLSRGFIDESMGLQRQIIESGLELWEADHHRQIKIGDVAEEMMAAIRAAQARGFRVQISVKTTSKLREKHKQGHATGARVFGYRLVHQGVGLGKHGLDQHTHVTMEIDPAQAAVVVRICELSASGMGDRTISNLLNTEGVLGPAKPKRKAVDKLKRRYSTTPPAWSYKTVQRILENKLYIGVSTLKGIEVKLPELRIVSDDLWQRVRARRKITNSHYLRGTAGQLLSKPESGLAAKYALSGIARCYSCHSGLKAYPGSGRDLIARYRCGLRARSGPNACVNSMSIPISELDESVRLAIHEMLTQDPEAVADLIAERNAALIADHAGQGDLRAVALEQAEKIQAEIDNLVALAASGKAPASILQSITDREVKVAELRATPEGPKPLDRPAFLKRFTNKSLGMLVLPGSAQQLRAAMRRLDVDSVTPYPAKDGGWTFEADADLAGLVTGGTLAERAG
jgi:DNA invertase Pin-like site-specific DNA recombinase